MTEAQADIELCLDVGCRCNVCKARRWARAWKTRATYWRDEAESEEGAGMILADKVIVLRQRIAELEKLLREGVGGFGHVLVQTSDQAGVNDWRRRVRDLLEKPNE